jgi:deoxyribonuclease-4
MSDNILYYGAHISIDLNNIVKSINLYGGNICQIFLTEPTKKIAPNISDQQINELIKYIKLNKIKIVIHSPYTLNFARIPLGIFDSSNISWWIKNLIDELNFGKKIGALGCVIHFGKYMELGKKVGMKNMYDSLMFVLQKVNDINIILETSSGQGTELCYRLEDFKNFYDMFSNKIKKRLRICIDTCHIFVAGYDIRNKKGVYDYFKLFNKLIGIKYICLVHLNDAKNDLGSKIDRHEKLGKGYIGLDGLKYFVKICNKFKIPIILETPQQNYTSEIKLIQKWAVK